MWEINLTPEQSKRLLNIYFKQAWDKMSENGFLNTEDAPSFIKELMTTPYANGKMAMPRPK